MTDLAKEIIKLGQIKDYERLEAIITKCDTKELRKIAVEKVGRADAIVFWNYLLIGFKCNSEAIANKRFTIITAVLNQLNKVEVTSKQSFDLITRLFIELPKLASNELIELCDYCIESLRTGDPKCNGWKDLFPEVITLLNDKPKISVQGTSMIGNEYRTRCFNNILELKWPESILPGIASMFREMKISKDEKILVLKKLCENVRKLPPNELPTLAYQLFSLCTSASLAIIPIFSFNEYFHRHYYRKKFTEMGSEQTNYDSIDNYSEKELREAQDTILYHLSTCTEYKINEKEMVNQFKALASNPRYVLTPFLISALLTMCNINRYLDSTRLSSSSTLPFLRTVIRNNERERELCENSAWCRNSLEQSVVNLKHVFSILIDQSKEGTDVVTAGIVGLAFILLKAPQNPSLNVLGIQFLEEFIKKRYIFGAGIVKNLMEFLFADQEAPQFAECLTRLSMTSTLTISECVGSIKEILDFFLLIPGQHAMRMMTFVVPLVKISNIIRDYFIDILRKAMYQSDLFTRQMGVYGFCLILKQLRNNSSCRGSASGLGSTQLSISGFSVMSQQIVDTANNPQRYFDMSVLEIIGILRKCFNQTFEIKEMLYDGLTNAIDVNPKLIPHILQFLDCHFRNYFHVTDTQVTIKFEKCVVEKSKDGIVTIQIWDHVGKLLQLVAFCIVKCEQSNLEFETKDLKEFFQNVIKRIDMVSIEQLGLSGTLTNKMNQIGIQYLNCLEGLMYYALKSVDSDLQSITTVIRLFKHHTECSEKLMKASVAVKKITRKKSDSLDHEVSDSFKMPSVQVVHKPENIWDLATMHNFVQALYCDTDPNPVLLSESQLTQYILATTCQKVEAMRTAPDYKQIKYSRSNFKYLSEISKLIFRNFVQHLKNVIDKFDTKTAQLSVECLRQCLTTAVKLYKRKFNDFLLVLRNSPVTNDTDSLLSALQNAFNEIVTNETDKNIPLKLLQCMEILYENLELEEKQAMAGYNWLYHVCKNRNVDSDEMNYIHKLLFNQHIRTQSGALFEKIAMQIQKVVSQIDDEPLNLTVEFNSITSITAESCTIYLCNSLRKHIEHVEYFILKVKSFCAKIKIGGQSEQKISECEQMMKTSERRICSQLILISNALMYLTNSCLPLGQCMDTLIKLLTQYYVCLSNLTKHFLIRHKIISLSFNHTKFDQLIKAVGKPLPLKIYRIISYIEDNIFDEVENDKGDDCNAKKQKKKDPKTDKAKIMRDTKYIPKLILRIENFNKFVNCLSKKTKHDLSKCLHVGTVRDFRIQTAALRKAIDRTFCESEQMEIDEDDLEREDEASDSESSDDNNSTKNNEATDEEHIDTTVPTPTTSSSNEAVLQETDKDSRSVVNALNNLKAINKRANKRKQRSTEIAKPKLQRKCKK